MEEEVKHLSFPDRRRGTFRSSHSWDPKGPSGLHKRSHFEVLTLGIPRDPADFIKDAHEIGHPRRAFARVPALMREVLEEVFLGDPFEIKSKRASFLKKWMKRAVQLRAGAATPCRSPSAPSTSAQRQKATVVERDSAGPSVPRLEDR